MILVLLLFFPPMLSLGYFLHKRNCELPVAKTLFLYGVFTLMVNLVDCLVIILVFNGRGIVLSPDYITISFACKYLLLSTCVAIISAYSAHYSINLICYLRKNLIFEVKLQEKNRKIKLTVALFISCIILIFFEIRYVILAIGKRSLGAYLFHVSNSMPLNSNEYFNASAMLKHIILPAVFSIVSATLVYFLFCRFVKYELALKLKLANKEVLRFSDIAKVYRFFLGTVLSITVTGCIYIGYIFYLHSTNPKLPDWIQNSNGLVAHALGGFEENSYLNSIDALQYNYDNGHRVFEMDLCLTSDKVLVGIHDWNIFGYNGAAPSINTFMRNKILDKYTPTTFEDVANFMFYNPDVYIITDKISSSDETAFYNIINACNSLDPSMLNRIIIQVYNQDGYHEVVKKYPYFNIIYTLYDSTDTDDEVVGFVEKTGINAITMRDVRASSEFVEKLEQRGAVVFAHTVNSSSAFEVLRFEGVYGVYTDFLKPEEITHFMVDAE